MKRAVIFLFIIYLISAVGGWYLFSKKSAVGEKIAQELVIVNNELTATKNALDTEKTARAILEKKVSDARVNATFLALALCPVLEATNKNALCIKNGTEWFSQTILAGTALTSAQSKIKMDALLVSLGKKTKPTAKQLYEMLKPIEIESLKALIDTLE